MFLERKHILIMLMRYISWTKRILNLGSMLGNQIRTLLSIIVLKLERKKEYDTINIFII